ncbi:IPT/TIG domain-containing protein [Paraflavitalea speifideaquila]|uniref:IPT/TIG domain-containing protein n=1 Tax=Paraflavitalea speifideaquila TaxID=3076558 RepID=UPI0028F07236|nr:IPT/TIG domain-containing protein [Paraflavitalea speifideiaquila]
MIAVAGFSPASGPIGTPVNITGSNLFDAKIKFNGIECLPTNRTSTSLTFAIPLNTTLTSHKIEVVSGVYTVQTQESFTVTHTGPYAHWEDKMIRLIYQDYPLFTGGLSFVYKNKIYWGFTEMFTGNDTAWYAVYDPSKHTDGWATIKEAPLVMAPLKLYGPAAVVHNDRVFFGTGMIHSTPSTFYSKWWEFHPETNTATQLTDYPEPTVNAITFTLNNKIYTGFGGTKRACTNLIRQATTAGAAGRRKQSHLLKN